MKYKLGDTVLIKGKVENVEGYGVAVYVSGLGKSFFKEEELDIVGKTYEQGLADAWELGRKLCDTTHEDRNKIFGLDRSCNGIKNVFERFTPEEALSKIEAYEREKEIKVGDEVVHGEGSFQTKFTVTFFESNKVEGFDKNGNTHSFCYPNPYIKKTGKHIDIESLLRQIGE